MNCTEIKKLINDGAFDSVLTEKTAVLKGDLQNTHKKLTALVDSFSEYFNAEENREIRLFSIGGRTEISGNHTDHNKGKILAASASLSILAAVSPRDDGIIRLKSEGFDEDRVTLSEISEPCADSFFTSASLISGVVKGFEREGFAVGGFDAYTVSDVLKGSGLSSSAAFEVTVGKILSALYNEDKIPPMEIAKIAKYAENVYFGKPCGLMDQAACAVGGVIAVDFENTDSPRVEKLDFSPTDNGYSLCIVDTGGCHADLNDDYAAVPLEMKKVAAFFGKSVLREISEEDVLENIVKLRSECGDRAVLRALHFFRENGRVDKISDACRKRDMKKFLEGIRESGNSSYKYLQNVYPPNAPDEQGLSTALFLSEGFISGECEGNGACRVHGGGFAGTVQAFIPEEKTECYKEYIERIFGKGTCHILKIRSVGAVELK